MKLGNEILARRVADLIAEVWGWPRKRLQQPVTEGLRNGPP